MADGAALKVALLARAGEAREQLRRAITDLGAELVVEADPNDLAAGALARAGVTTVLVSVEPAVEAALDRLDDDLLASAITVMYDEAETTSKLTGWDQARWARHLAAKLLGCDVLPPGAEPEAHQEAAEHLVPGAPAAPAALAAAAPMADFTGEANASALEVPSAYRPSDAPVAEVDPAPEAPSPPASWATPPVTEGDPEHLDLDLAALEQAMVATQLAEAAPSRVVEAVVLDPAEFAIAGEPELVLDEAIDLRGLELVDDAALADLDRPSAPSVSLLSARELDLGDFASTPLALDDGSGLDVEELTLSEEELAAFGRSSSAGFANSASRSAPAADEAMASELDMDDDLAKLAAAFDENLESVSFEAVADDLDDHFAGFDERDTEASVPARTAAEPPPLPDFGFAEGAFVADAAKAAPALPDISGLSLSADDSAPVPAAAAKRDFDFSALGSLELAPMDDAPAVSPPPALPAVAVPTPDLDHLSLSPLGEAGDTPSDAVGTVLVLSGIGGPDAVRQLVRALPAGFPLSVLLHQNLDGGRHDRFVEQLAKISRLPVALAEPTETPPAKAVRVLPEGLSSAGALSFPKAGGMAALVQAVTAVDGAVVVLSGADESAVEPLKAAMAQGIRVLVQDPASCFDAKAASALRDAGATALPAIDIAARLDAHFPA